MSKKIYAGNLSFATTEDRLSNLFGQYGEVLSASIIKDKVTGQSKGFGFVEMTDDVLADKAIDALNGKEVDGRRIRVSEAQDRPRRNSFGRDSYDRRGGDDDRRSYGRRNDFSRGSRGDYRRDNRGGYRNSERGYRSSDFNEF